MASRGIRLRGLLQTLGQLGEDEKPDWSRRSSHQTRTLWKDEMIRIADLLEIDAPHELTVPEIRDTLREEVRGLNERKSGRSVFSSGELFRLDRRVGYAQYLDAEEWDEVPASLAIGDTLIIDGDREFDVSMLKMWLADELDGDVPYDRAVAVHSGQRERLMFLYGLDKSVCKYESSVVLEQAHDYGPYKEWRRDAYVSDLEGA